MRLDEKVFLHEFLHMKYKDTIWTFVICFWKCIHWCNPFLAYCANRALNDLESCCDQRVLELLEGEERRAYGKILLSMVNEKYAKTPGTTCINNGGKHIRERIEAIARFKKYPVGMKLVSICVICLLTIFLTAGAGLAQVKEFENSVALSMASARSTPCTTVAGALDTYGKAILEYNGYYRTMCAPLDLQEELCAQLSSRVGKEYPEWDSGIECWPNVAEGYAIYNLALVEENMYEATLVLRVNYPPNGKPQTEGMVSAAYQRVRVELENGRWVVIPFGEFQYFEDEEVFLNWEWGCRKVPGTLYSASTEDFLLEVNYQTVHLVDNTIQSQNDMSWMFGSHSYFDTIPKPSAEFAKSNYNYDCLCTYLGSEEERNEIWQLGSTIRPLYEGEERPEIMRGAGGMGSGGSSTDGESWSSNRVEHWEDSTYRLSSGGGGFASNKVEIREHPQCFAVNLYVNGKLHEKLDLYVQEGEILQ